MFNVYKEMTGHLEDSVMVCSVDTKEDLEVFLARPENNLQRFYFLNSKGEEVDKNLVVIMKPSASMASMVGALKDKFTRIKK